MIDSILQSVRVACNIVEDDTSFDTQLIPLIGANLLDVCQIGIGDKTYSVTDESATWSEFNSDKTYLNPIVSTIVCEKVRLEFDAPSSSALKEELENSIARHESRLSYEVDPE